MKTQLRCGATGVESPSVASGALAAVINTIMFMRRKFRRGYALSLTRPRIRRFMPLGCASRERPDHRCGLPCFRKVLRACSSSGGFAVVARRGRPKFRIQIAHLYVSIWVPGLLQLDIRPHFLNLSDEPLSGHLGKCIPVEDAGIDDLA